MKSKKLTSLLIAFVAVLWAIIFYRIYLTLVETDEVIMIKSAKKSNFFNEINHMDDKHPLKLNHRNPFVSINSPVRVEDKMDYIEKHSSIPTQKKTIPAINWSGIVYTGYINNVTNKQKLVIIQMQGREFMIAEGQILNGLKLIKYAGDSIKIQHQNQSKYIKLR
ncbi:MAG: hypothetical protein EOO43_05110 [Flavobacterium sp.]|nr:MAG: hypothetical protein EOO43_05110 [Flavobacterium sp.]